MSPSKSYTGNNYLPFQDLVKLDKVDDHTFKSTATPFSPGGAVGPNRAYGGHVYAQAAWAASQTVNDGFLLHSINGSFLLPGLLNVPFTYTISRLRTGRSFATRLVNVTQSSGVCFTCTCSFKRAESSPLDVQPTYRIPVQYSAVLADKRPEDFEECPSTDAPWYWRRREESGFNDAFPGLEMRKVDMSAYNSTRHPLERRQLIFYRPLSRQTHPLPRSANLHLSAHLYASDRNSLYIVANHVDVGDMWKHMGSLSHTVIFHTGIEDLWFEDEEWFVKEDWTDRVGDGRGVLHSRIWNPRTGRLVATVLQDGMIRVQAKGVATKEEVSRVREVERSWPPAEDERRKVQGKL